MPAPPPVAEPKSSTERFEEAASVLAASLNDYSDAAYRASQQAPDEELNAAYHKVEVARKLVREGRLAYALGGCLPEHVRHWTAWIQRDDFQEWVDFAATEITAVQSKEEDSSCATIDFTFNCTRYRLILRDHGMSPVPDTAARYGEVEFFANGQRVAKFELVEDLMKEYSEWSFCDVRALKVGPWMKEVIDMATQIEASRRKHKDDIFDQRAREAGREIDLG